jgi:uncharacterized protein YunC (DUF1805 family)
MLISQRNGYTECLSFIIKEKGFVTCGYIRRPAAGKANQDEDPVT